MQIVATPLYEQQLQALLQELSEESVEETIRFKMYLDTIIINMPSKYKKYKPSIFFEDETVKDIELKGLIIPFFYDESNDTYVLLGVVKAQEVQSEH